jgi:hypothetical protein
MIMYPGSADLTIGGNTRIAVLTCLLKMIHPCQDSNVSHTSFENKFNLAEEGGFSFVARGREDVSC